MEAATNHILRKLRTLSRAEVVSGMQRFGIDPVHAWGIPVPDLRRIARETGRDQQLALGLWASQIHEARILASMVADPAQFTEALCDRWTADFDSWDICDQCCYNLYRQLPYAYDKVYEYAEDDREFVRRAAFALIASLAVGDKNAPDECFVPFFDLIVAHAGDDRNFVRKAVNWALRQTGKRNRRLHAPALEISRQLAASTDKTARWIGRDALRELNDPKTVVRIKD